MAENNSADAKQHEPMDWIKNAVTEDESAEPEKVSGDIVLEGRLGIAEAEAMYDEWSRVLHAHLDISLQTEGLSRVDAAGVQLLYALVQEAKKSGSALKWLSVSDALRASAEALGLTENMGFEV